MADNKEVDHVSGVETTGHEWDGIRELNNPLPRWWLWTFYACCIWAVAYWVVMPAWPLISSHTTGMIGYSSRAQLAKTVEQAREAQSAYLTRIDAASLEEIAGDQELLDFALAGGGSAFAVNCSQCHGRGAAGYVGYPNLNDDDWIWGGDLAAIDQTIHFGIRSDHDETRLNEMPAYGRDEILTREEIDDVAEYVLSLSASGSAAAAAAAARGQEIFAEQCSACHMEDGKGDYELGAPNLTDAIWLYGGEKTAVVESITNSRAGMMPAWTGRLDETTIKQLAIYVHSLGGGE
ncbi:cytochrome-c oxidase, cbb3-type subunit III [Pelagibius litoralis]|uniref:Cbb3-type cytochrome c oxidase subunit n=1 Tax=Pelagibius litoralis TaxID=374515 RepID=A0A967C9A2_9PROT|nr:cytochrome-c oxidase, cbb3-type subunit III [Pelagibius litoralis]NIA69177.1 cytochrome-c oxidase, cbb3-type subunit III [Pelagibius litoralis]